MQYLVTKEENAAALKREEMQNHRSLRERELAIEERRVALEEKRVADQAQQTKLKLELLMQLKNATNK